MSAAPTATRHECAHNLSVLCTKGHGRPKRKTCAYCGGRLRTETGLWGVFTWTSANRYPAEAAHATFAHVARAEARADADNLVAEAEGRKADAVVRWIPA